jgi:hypothetical protein
MEANNRPLVTLPVVSYQALSLIPTNLSRPILMWVDLPSRSDLLTDRLKD